MKKFITFFTLFLCLTFIVTSFAQTLNIPLDWDKVDGSNGYKVYYGLTSSATGGVGATQGNSPIVISDPNQIDISVTGLPQDTWYFKVSAFNGAGESPASAYKVYETVKGFDVVTPGEFGLGNQITFKINFETTTAVTNGNLIVRLNSGAYIIVPQENLNWKESLDVNYTITAQDQLVSPLVISDIYVDPNDPDVMLKGAGGYEACTDIVTGTNLDHDPNNIISIVSIPGTPTGFLSGCCTN